MRRVTTVSLNGNSYQIEEAGYAALQEYLGAAEQRLADSPDRAEILADLEQAIAEKCSRYLGPHKNVVSTDEIAQVIREMGPVEPAAPGDAHGEAQREHRAGQAGSTADTPGSEQAQASGSTHSTEAPKRLYQIREGAMISGVCNGIAAYLGIDVTLVRIVFVLLALVTGGVWILMYIVLMFVIPYAHTTEQRAAAHGWAFNAEELIERAKQQLRDGQHRYQQRAQWRHERRQWRHQQRMWKAQQRWGGTPPPAWSEPPRPPDASYATQVLAGVLFPIGAVVGMLLLFTLILGIISLVRTHAIFGWPLPYDVPLWVAIVVLVVIYGALVSPLHALHRARYYAYGAVAATLGGVLWAAFVVVCLWAAWRHWPELQHFLQQLQHPHTVTQLPPAGTLGL